MRRALASAHNVKARGDDVRTPPALRKVVVQGKDEKAVRGVDKVGGHSQLRSELLDLAAARLDSDLPRLARKTVARTRRAIRLRRRP